MSITAVCWFLVLAGLLVLSLKRPVYALSLYFFTFFLSPTFWWWGDEIPDLRWNLLTGCFLLAIAIAQRLREGAPVLPEGAWLKGLAIAILVNASFIHFFLAADPVLSSEPYWLLAKFVLLFFLMLTVIRTPEDMNTLVLTLVLGAAYVGYEVTINDRGNVTGSRLEGVGVAGVQNSNELAALLLVVLPLAGSLLFTGTKYQKVAVVLAGPLILNTVLLCNSRGAFLALIAMAVVILIAAPGRARRHVTVGLALGGVALFFLLGDEEIIQRFLTVFADPEERDNSAASRLELWQAALAMIPEHPLGAGGDGFKAYADIYLPRVGLPPEARAVHNGYLTETTEWGLQGLLLRAIFALGAALTAFRVVRRHRTDPDGRVSMLGACLLSAWVGWLVTSMFGDYIDNEWGYWIAAMMLSYAAIYHAAPALAGAVETARAPDPAAAATPHAASARVSVQPGA